LRLHEIVDASEAIGATRSRGKKVAALAKLLAGRTPFEVGTVVAWLSGVLPQGRIGVGWAAVSQVKDLPASAAPSLEVAEVDAVFTAIQGVSGAGSTRERLRLLGDLLGRATPPEQRFLARLVLGELRQGALEGLMADAVAEAAEVPAAAVRRAAMLSGDLGATALAAFEAGEAGLARFRIELFRPLQPMLAQTADDVEDALGHLGTAALEYKLDGARIQVHRRGDRVRVYTRNLREVTPAVPEVVEAVRALPAGEVLLDGEVLALRPDGTPLPFQVTMRRFGRKLDVAAMRSELPLSPFFFDCLLLDGTELIDATQAERLAAVAVVVPAARLVPWCTAGDSAAAAAFLSAAIRDGHEGIMAKDPGAAYAAGSRGRAWLKVKPIHTLDLVVLAAEWGSGRRRGWLSNLHLGARDPDSGGFAMLGKTFKGLTDEMLAWQTERFLALETHRDDFTVHVRPEQVVEVAFNEVQASPRYPAGLALRFARVKRYRSDKIAAQADTLATVRAIHEGRIRPR